MAEQHRLLDRYSAGSSVHASAPPTSVTNPRRTITSDNIRTEQSLDARELNLHNTGATIDIAREKPEHRIMVYLKAQGYTNREIAKATGYTESWISQITRQPWFKERLSIEMREAGLDPIKRFLSGEALPSLETLAEIRDDDLAPAAARVAATNAILDRAFGKPTQHIESKSTVDVTNARVTADRLEAELKAIEEQLAARGVSSPN